MFRAVAAVEPGEKGGNLVRGTVFTYGSCYSWVEGRGN